MSTTFDLETREEHVIFSDVKLLTRKETYREFNTGLCDGFDLVYLFIFLSDRS